MAQTKKTGSGSRKSSNSRNATKKTSSRKNVRQADPISDELMNEIILIITGALAVFWFLCNFGILGAFGNAVRDFTFGIFGLPNYIMPIVIAFLFIFGMVNAGDKIATRKIVASILLYLMIASSCELIFNKPDRELSISIKDIFDFAKTNHKGGGFLGGITAYFSVKYLDMIGAILLILVISIICIIIISDKSFVNLVKEGSTKAYETGSRSAKAASLRRERVREVNARNREERAKQRALRKEEAENEKLFKEVSGVTTYNFVQEEEVPATKEESDGLHEINLTNIDEAYDNREIEIQVHGVSDEPDNIKEISYEDDIYEGLDESEESDYVTDTEDYFDPYADDDAPVPVARVKTVINGAIDSGINASELDLSNNKIENTTINQSSKVETKKPRIAKPYKKPPLSLLTKGNSGKNGSSAELKATAAKLEEVLKSFGVKVTVTDISQGPAVTRYEMIPETGVKVSKIVSLADDIKLNLAAADIRIEAPIPGKAAIGIEVPNKESQAVLLRDLLESKEFNESSSTISFAVGKDIAGKTVVADIGKMPHMLIAGATGSGKSVCINTLIMSILYKANPDEVKLIMIDPKVVELSVYNNIPHLLIPVVTDPKKASAALAWAVSEMNDRYQKFADYGVRDLKGYNEKIKSEVDAEGNPVKPMYKLIVIVDELADMMMVAGKEVEESICRLAQLARAAGIHLILATQRPSVDVITGLIKANMPSRIAFSVSSGVDSRTILDMNGAEKLLGKGDMLFYPQGYTKPARVQGAFVSDNEVSDVVQFLKNQQLGNTEEDINERINSMSASSGGSANGSSMNSSSDSDIDEYFVEAGRVIVQSGKCSIGMLQRKFKIGFNRAARIMDSLSEYNVVGPEEGTKPRTILMTPEEFEFFVENL